MQWLASFIRQQALLWYPQDKLWSNGVSYSTLHQTNNCFPHPAKVIFTWMQGNEADTWLQFVPNIWKPWFVCLQPLCGMPQNCPPSLLIVRCGSNTERVNSLMKNQRMFFIPNNNKSFRLLSSQRLSSLRNWGSSDVPQTTHVHVAKWKSSSVLRQQSF